MAAALYALKIYTRDVSNCHIQLKVGNTSSLAWINKKTAPNEAIFLIVKEFWDYCMGKNLGVSASYINTTKNVVADKESRKLRNNLEWSLQTPIFDKIRLFWSCYYWSICVMNKCKNWAFLFLYSRPWRLWSWCFFIFMAAWTFLCISLIFLYLTSYK